MHRPRIFHPCGQNLPARDASTRDFSSLQTKSPRQGCIASGFFHPCRQNLPARDASTRDFSSMQTKSSRQGCIASAIILQTSGHLPQSAELTSIYLNACRAHLIKPTVLILTNCRLSFPMIYYISCIYAETEPYFFAFPSNSSMYLSKSDINNLSCITRYFSNSVSA